MQIRNLIIFLALIFCITLNASQGNNNDKITINNIPFAKSNKKITPKEVWERELQDPLLEKAKLEKEKRQKDASTPPAKKSILHRILMYFPNRIIDLTDIFTFELGFGPEASILITFTKWAEFGGCYGDRYFIAKNYNRQYGGGYHGGYTAAFACMNKEEAFTDYTFGTLKPYAFIEKDHLVPRPTEEVYRDGLLDFWKIGVHAGWIVDVGAAIHPVAIVNFLTGFFFIRLTDTEEL